VAEPPGERGAERLGVGDAADGDEGDEEADGAGPAVPPWHAAPLIVHPAGWPAAVEDPVTKPTVTGLPGSTAASQLALFTVTGPPSSVYEPPHSEVSFVPGGSVKASVQPLTAAVPGFVIVYWPLYPVPQLVPAW
jgi:hypothetical protein